MESINNDRLHRQRNYGIDLLRIISMFLVVILHVLGKGGILENLQTEGRYAVGWFLEIGAYCAVNCYALISGFVGYSEKTKVHKYSRYIVLWMQVVFYCISITVLFLMMHIEPVSKKLLLKAFFPVTYKEYWYFSAYTGVFFLMPWLNSAVRNFSKEEATKLVCWLGALFSLYTTFSRIIADTFNIVDGYSFLWVLIVYMIGACIKKCELHKKIKKKQSAMIAIGAIIFTWIWKLGVGKLSISFVSVNVLEGIWISYTSPTILGLAIALLIFFSQVEVGECMRKAVAFVSPAAFGIYLFHTHPLVFVYGIKGNFSGIANLPAWLLLFAVLAVAGMIFIIGILIDKIREGIFKILNLNRLAEKIEILGRNIVEKHITKDRNH